MRRVFAIMALAMLCACHTVTRTASATATSSPLALPVGTPTVTFPNVPLVLHSVARIGKSTMLTVRQEREAHIILGKTKPQYRRDLKYALVGPRLRLAIVFSPGQYPSDNGPESYVLNACTTTPHCHYACDWQMHYSEGSIAPLPMPNCLDGRFYFMKNESRATDHP